jgi:hypothetical protein
MKDPQDCTYPQEALCLHDCKQECQKRSGWRKKQIDDAEEEAWKEMEKASAMRETQRLGQEIEQEQLISDQINYGMSVTQGGKRIDPMSIYKEPEQEPVAWLSTDSIGERYLCFDKPLDNDPVQPLYTHPTTAHRARGQA